MNNESSGTVLTIIGLFFSLMLVVLQSSGYFSNEIILNPYFWAVIIVVILILLIFVVYKMNDRTKKDLKKVKTFQDNIVNDLKVFKSGFEEKFKIHDRLNKLELKVFNGKKRSS
jgi:uncharacterized protein YacL